MSTLTKLTVFIGQVARYKELVAVMNKYRSGRNLDTNEGRTETLGESIQENAQEAQSTATSSSNIENTSNTTRNVEEVLHFLAFSF